MRLSPEQADNLESMLRRAINRSIGQPQLSLNKREIKALEEVLRDWNSLYHDLRIMEATHGR